MASIDIRKDTCVGCEACIPACPFGAISMEDGLAVIGDTCTLCGACESACPYGAIVIRTEETGKDDQPLRRSRPAAGRAKVR